MWVSYIIHSEEDTPKIIDLFRLQYARLKNKSTEILDYEILHLQSYVSNLQKLKNKTNQSQQFPGIKVLNY